jgi:hypothetical protein
MFAAQMTNHCGINSWTRNSRIIHAVSDSPGGLFVPEEEVQPVFAHEPTVTRSPDGKWVMWYTTFLKTGVSRNTPCSCEDGSTGDDCTNGEMSKDPSYMIYAESPSGEL